MNVAHKAGAHTALDLRNLFIESDVHRDPQAYVLSPDFVVKVAAEMVSQKDHYNAALRGSLKGLELCREAIKSGELKSSERENEWLDRIVEELSSLPSDESQFIAEMSPFADAEKCHLDQYGL